jgi:hypothetical protein
VTSPEAAQAESDRLRRIQQAKEDAMARAIAEVNAEMAASTKAATPSVKAPSAWQIEAVMAIANAALSRLEASDTEIATDDEALLTALRAEGADVDTILRRLVLASLEAQSMAKGIKGRMDDLRARKERFEKRAETWRGATFGIMDALGITKHTQSEYTASIQPGRQSLVVTDEAALPEEYFVVTKSPDIAKIKAALADGVVVDGAEMQTGAPILTVRSK